MAAETHESASTMESTKPVEIKPEDQEVVAEATEFFSFVQSYEDLQRRSESEQLAFEGVDMWDAEARKARKKHTDEEGNVIPEKPTLSVNLMDQQVQVVVSEARQARLALTVKPRAGTANTKTSDRLKAMVRTIQVASGALAVRLWALERTVKVGRGFYFVDADYANDDDFDLDLIITRILDQGTVYFDPYSVAPDGRDVERVLVTDLISEGERKRRWPHIPIVAPSGAFEDGNEWFVGDSEDPKNRQIRIATYYRVKRVPKTLAYHPIVGKGWLDEMPPDVREAIERGEKGTMRRKVEERKVEILVLDGTQVLERTEWLGRYIPVIRTIGKEYFVEGKRRFKGIIAEGMDLSKAINVVLSAAVEVAGSTPRSPYIMAEGQDEGHEAMWDNAAVKNYTRLIYNPVDVNGQPAQPPMRQSTEPQIQGLMLLLRMLHEMYHGVMGTVAPQFRAADPRTRSGVAIEALQSQGKAGTAAYLDNLASISMQYEGMVLIDAIPKYYDKPGRVVHLMGEGDEDDTVILIKRPFIVQDGQAIGVPCPTCSGTGQTKAAPVAAFMPPIAPEPCTDCKGDGYATKENAPQEWQGKPVEYVDFSEGIHTVTAAVDKSYQTKQEEALSGMSQLAQSAPALVPAYAAEWVRAMGFSGSKLVADKIAAMTNPQAEGNELEGLPPSVQARFRQLQQQHKAALQALEEAKRLIDTDAVKQAGAKEVATIRAAVTAKVEEMRQQGRVIEAGIAQKGDREITTLQGQIDQMQQESQHRHEVLLALISKMADAATAREMAATAPQPADQ